MDIIIGIFVLIFLVIYIIYYYLILKLIKNKDGGRVLMSIYIRFKVFFMFLYVIFVIIKFGWIGLDKVLLIVFFIVFCNKNIYNYIKGFFFIIVYMLKLKFYMKLGFLSLWIDEGFWRK